MLLVAVALCLWACGNEAPTRSSGTEYQFVYPQESAMLALVESREFRPPKNLQIQIDLELTAIREQWGDSIPEVLLPYNDPWSGWYGVAIVADSTMLSGSDTLARRVFDAALGRLGASTTRVDDWFRVNCIVWPEHYWYPPAAVDSLAGLPGIREVRTAGGPVVSTVFTSFVRRTSDRSSFWYMGAECGMDYSLYNVFEVTGRRARFVERVQLCYPNIDSAWAAWDAAGLSYVERSRIEQAYTDSVLANLPDWWEAVRGEVHGYKTGDHQNAWSTGQ
jgi:hypothetical protein